jgi:hypothetical protein
MMRVPCLFVLTIYTVIRSEYYYDACREISSYVLMPTNSGFGYIIVLISFSCCQELENMITVEYDIHMRIQYFRR